MSKLIDKEKLIEELLKLPGVGSNSNAMDVIYRFESPEVELNENQEIVLDWLKERCKKHNERPSTVIYFLTNHYSFAFEDHGKAKRAFRSLDSAQELQVLQAFATWALNQC